MSKTFTYIKYDEETTKKSEDIKLICEQLESKILDLGKGRYQSLAITNLEICFAMAGKALRDIQIEKSNTILHLPERNES